MAFASSLTFKDDPIMKEPYAEAALFMGCKPDLVYSAAQNMKKRKMKLEASALMQEVQALEQRGGAPPSPEVHRKTPRRDNYGSDGESENGSLEYMNGKPASHYSDDLQTDSEPVLPEPQNTCENYSEEWKMESRKSDTTDPRTAHVTALRLKLKTLREENRRLKARQLCRSCHQHPVSVTFLPCGHYSFCYECGQGFNSCPLCGKTILADVRTFLA